MRKRDCASLASTATAALATEGEGGAGDDQDRPPHSYARFHAQRMCLPWLMRSEDNGALEAPPPRSKRILKEGALYKRGHVRKNWNLRYFELTSTSLCYKTAKEGEEKGRLYVRGASVSPVDEGEIGRPFCFRLETSAEHLIIQTPDYTTRDQWMAALTDVASLPPDKCDFLSKCGHNHKMLVDGDTEVTLLEESSRRCRGREHCFMVCTEQYELVLQAKTPEQRDDWVTFLRQQTRGDAIPGADAAAVGDRDDIPILRSSARSESRSTGSIEPATGHGLRTEAGSTPPDASEAASEDSPPSAAGAADERAAERPASAASIQERPSALARLRKARKAGAGAGGGSQGPSSSSSSASRLARIRRPSLRSGSKSGAGAGDAEVYPDPAQHVRLSGAVREGAVVELLALDGGKLADAGAFSWYRTASQVCESEDDARRDAAEAASSGGGGGGGGSEEKAQPRSATDAAVGGQLHQKGVPNGGLEDAPSSSTSSSSTTSSSSSPSPTPTGQGAEAAVEPAPAHGPARGKRGALAARLVSGDVPGSERIPGASKPSFRPSAGDVGSFLCCVYEPQPGGATADKQQQRKGGVADREGTRAVQGGGGEEGAAEIDVAGAPAGGAGGEAAGEEAEEGETLRKDGCRPLVVCTRRAVGPVEPVVTRAHLKLLPHVHTLHCDRAERVCTAMGRWREGECVSLQVKGERVDPSRTLVRWQRQRCDDAEVLSKAGAIASSRAATEAWKRDGERVFGPWEDVVPSAVSRRRRLDRARRSAQAGATEAEEERGKGADEEGGDGSAGGPLTLATAPRYRFMCEDVGARIRCIVTPVSSRGVSGQDMEVAATAVVEAAPPKLLNLRIVGTPRPGGHLFAVGDYWGGREGESEYWWVGIRRDGSRVGEYMPRVRLTEEQVRRGVVQLPPYSPDPSLMTVDEEEAGGASSNSKGAGGAEARPSARVDEPADGVVVGFGAPPIPSGTEGYADADLRALEAAMADADPRLLPVTEDMVGMRFKVKCRPRRKDGEDGQIVTSKLSARVEGEERGQEADSAPGEDA